MSNYTEHYNLKKPLKSEKYDVDVANTNNDIIDEKIFGKVDKIAGKSLSSNDFTDGYKQKVDKLIEGTKGDSAYQVALTNGFEGTETQWLASLKGDKGDTGDVSKEELKEVTENKRLKLEGKSEQSVRSGKNKLKITNFTDTTTDGVTFTAKFSNNKELEYIEAKGNSTTGYNAILSINISDLPAGDYIINGLGTNKVIRYVLLKNNDTNPKIITNDGDTRFTQDSSSPYIRFRIDLYMAGEVNTKIKPMIRQASITDNTYEPYGVSPSPDYPGRIRNIGDNVNLAEYVEGLWFNSVSLKFINSENTYGFIAKVKPNTQYIINKKYAGNRFIVVSSSIYPQKDADVVRNIFTSNHNLTQYTFTTQSNEKYIFLGVYYKTDFETEEEELKKAIAEVKIEEGSTAGPYTEYGCGSVDYEINTTQNIFNKDTDIELDGQYRRWDTGDIAINQYYYGVKEKVKGNKEYKVFSYQDYSNLCYFDKNMTYITGDKFGKDAKKNTFKTPSNCEYITLAVAKSGINEFSITEVKQIHFSLSKGQLLHEEDYLASDGIHNIRSMYTFTINDNWQQTDNKKAGCFTLHKPTPLKEASLTYIPYCTNLIGVMNNNYEKTDVPNSIGIAGDRFNVYIPSATSIDECKSIMANQTVEYKLAEEIVTPLTKEQIEAFYELQKAKYVDKMTLTCLNEIEPTLTDIDKSLEESLLDVEKLLAMLSLNS